MNCFRTQALLCLSIVFFCGCGGQEVAEKPKPKRVPIIGKKTQDIGEFDPADGEEVSDGKVKLNIVTGAAGAYGPLVEQVSDIAVVQALSFFYANEGRYPKDHDEFMTKVIKANRIKLAMLPHGQAYKYDVKNHKLVVVRVKKLEEDQ